MKAFLPGARLPFGLFNEIRSWVIFSDPTCCNNRITNKFGTLC